MFVTHTSNCHGQNCTRRVSFKLGIYTLIANILVSFKTLSKHRVSHALPNQLMVISSNPCNMVIFFLFFSMTAAAILDFKIFKFLTVGTFKRVKLHHCVKFR